MRKSGAGFTLIELLVAISIIAVLSIISLVAYQGVTARARDSIRKSDLNSIAFALEIAFQKNGSYIEGNGTCELDTPKLYDALASYMSDGVVPRDPLTKVEYCYISLQAGGKYILYAKLENCKDPDIIDPATCASDTYNYKLESTEALAQDIPSPQPALPVIFIPLPGSNFYTGLVSYWKMDETTTVVDSAIADSVDSNQGTVKGAVTSVPGIIGNGMSFDGNPGSFIEIGDKTNLNLTTFTIAGWIKLTGECGQYTTCPIFSKGMSGFSGYSLELAKSNGRYRAVLNIRDNWNLTNEVVGDTGLDINIWYHIVGTFDGATMAMNVYVNGVSDGTGTATDLPTPAGQTAKIGSRNSDNQITTKGVIDEVQIWNKALTAEEIFALYQFTCINPLVIDTTINLGPSICLL